MSTNYGPETIECPPLPGGYCTIELLHTEAGWLYGYGIRLQYVSRASYNDWTKTGARRIPDSGPERSRRDAIYNAAACIRVLLPSLGWDTNAHNKTKAKILNWLDELAPVQISLFNQEDKP